MRIGYLTRRRRSCRIPLALAVTVILLAPGAAFSQVYMIGNYVAASGGGQVADASYEITGTIGQPAVGFVADGSYEVSSGVLHVTSGVLWTDVKDDRDGAEVLPWAFGLDQNYPNPFNPVTTIRFTLPSRSRVSMKLFNILGQQIDVLADGEYQAGEHNVVFNAEQFSSGIYFYRLEADGRVESRKLVLLK